MTTDDHPSMSTDQPDSTRQVDIRHTGPGRAEILLDGIDIAPKVFGYHLEATADRAQPFPVLTLELHPGAARDAAFAGLAEVQVAVSDPGPAAAVFLEAIDAETLETTALSRMDLGSGPHDLTRAMLRQLQEWARGRA